MNNTATSRYHSTKVMGYAMYQSIVNAIVRVGRIWRGSCGTWSGVDMMIDELNKPLYLIDHHTLASRRFIVSVSVVIRAGNAGIVACLRLKRKTEV